MSVCVCWTHPYENQSHEHSHQGEEQSGEQHDDGRAHVVAEKHHGRDPATWGDSVRVRRVVRLVRQGKCKCKHTVRRCNSAVKREDVLPPSSGHIFAMICVMKPGVSCQKFCHAVHYI